MKSNLEPGNLMCEKCGNALYSGWVLQCLTVDCENYKKKYKFPVMELVEIEKTEETINAEDVGEMPKEIFEE